MHVVHAVFPKREREDVGRRVNVTLLQIDLMNTVIIHKRHVHLHVTVHFFEFQHRVTATADQQAKSRRDLIGLLLVFNVYPQFFEHSDSSFLPCFSRSVHTLQ